MAKAVDELGLTRSYVLYQLANEAKIPAQWRELFSGASDLESAFLHLRQRIYPRWTCRFRVLQMKVVREPRLQRLLALDLAKRVSSGTLRILPEGPSPLPWR